MNFKDLKPDYSVYVLDRKALHYVETKVVSVSAPRYENKIGVQPCTVVDVTLEQEGKNVTYVFPSDANKAYNGNCMFCTDRLDVITDTKSIRRASENALNEMDNHKVTIERCNQLLAEMDPEQKERQRTEARFTALEDGLSQIKDMLMQMNSRNT